MATKDLNDPTLPHTECLIIDGDLLALKTNDGYLVARRVDGEFISKRDTNWPSIAGGAAAGPLQSDGTTAGSLPDSPRTLTAEGGGRTFLYNKTEDHIWQVFGSIDWPLCRIFQEIPLGTPQGQLTRELLAPTLSASAISTWGWQWSGYQSLIGDARRIAMFLLPYDVEVGFAVFNEASYAHTMLFEWLINKIKYDPLDPKDKDDAKIIIDVLKGRIPAVKWSPGLTGFNYAPGFRKIFKVDPVVLTKRQVIGKGVTGDYVLGGV